MNLKNIYESLVHDYLNRTGAFAVFFLLFVQEEKIPVIKIL